jgi:hypothetical protein
MPDLTAGCILFLDFDGVTHPEPCEKGELFLRLPLIEDVLREFGTCKIVISSSWRAVHGLDEMREYFAADMQSRVIGVTPEYSVLRLHGIVEPAATYHRQWECESWLQHKQVWLPQNRRLHAPWIAIDDRPDWFCPDCGNLLPTRTDTGFGADDATRLQAMLEERLRFTRR